MSTQQNYRSAARQTGRAFVSSSCENRKIIPPLRFGDGFFFSSAFPFRHLIHLPRLRAFNSSALESARPPAGRPDIPTRFATKNRSYRVRDGIFLLILYYYCYVIFSLLPRTLPGHSTVYNPNDNGCPPWWSTGFGGFGFRGFARSGTYIKLYKTGIQGVPDRKPVKKSGKPRLRTTCLFFWQHDRVRF